MYVVIKYEDGDVNVSPLLNETGNVKIFHSRSMAERAAYKIYHRNEAHAEVISLHEISFKKKTPGRFGVILSNENIVQFLMNEDDSIKILNSIEEAYSEGFKVSNDFGNFVNYHIVSLNEAPLKAYVPGIETEEEAIDAIQRGMAYFKRNTKYTWEEVKDMMTRIIYKARCE